MYSFLAVSLLASLSVAQVHQINCEQLRIQPIADFARTFPSYPSVDRNYYAKFVDVAGVPIMSSSRTTDAGLIESARWACEMFSLANPAVLQSFINYRGRHAVMARYPQEKTTDVPEHSSLSPKDYWDERARGLGAMPSNPVGSNAEENALCDADDRYRGECIMIHEFAHSMSLLSGNQTFLDRLDQAYSRSMAAGLWQNTYTATNAQEYFAEGVQAWFDCNQYRAQADGVHNDINTREKLKTYDPTLAGIIGEFFRETPLKYSCPNNNPPSTTTTRSATQSGTATASRTSTASSSSTAKPTTPPCDVYGCTDPILSSATTTSAMSMLFMGLFGALLLL